MTTKAQTVFKKKVKWSLQKLTFELLQLDKITGIGAGDVM